MVHTGGTGVVGGVRSMVVPRRDLFVRMPVGHVQLGRRRKEGEKMLLKFPINSYSYPFESDRSSPITD